MRIMAVSDLHGNLEGLDPKGADVVVIAGDVAPLWGRGPWHINDQKKWINRRFRNARRRRLRVKPHLQCLPSR